MYLNDFFTVPMSARRDPGDLDPGRAGRSPRAAARELPVGFQIAAPAFGEQKLLDAAYALERAIGFDAAAARGWPDG